MELGTTKTRTMAAALLFAGLGAWGAYAAAAAQNAAPGNLQRFTIGGAAANAQVAKVRDEISLDTARRIADVCLQFAAAHNQRVSIFVLSPDGQIVHAARMDGQGPVNIETAMMKAKTALYMRDSTRAWSNRLYDNQATELRWLKLDQYWVPGGLPIMVDGVLIGAIGVGGANLDEECAYAGLTQVLGPQPPLEPVLPPRPLPARPDPVPHVQ
jgi:uncharacterized protein GlcG (DUF336 family)